MLTRKIFASFALALLISLSIPSAVAATGSAYPSEVVKNQFGETYINSITGGSNQIDCNFIVDSTNGNGLGIRSLKGPCSEVTMHTSATPASNSRNPAAGYIHVKLSSQFYGYVGGYSGFVTPVSGTPINVTTGVTIHQPYIIASVGTTTPANWTTLGVPAGLTPTAGQSFIALATASVPGTGIIEAPLASGSGVYYIDMIGDPNQMPTATGGADLLMRVMGPTSTSNPTPVATAPADGTVIGLRFVMLPLSSQLK